MSLLSLIFGKRERRYTLEEIKAMNRACVDMLKTGQQTAPVEPKPDKRGGMETAIESLVMGKLSESLMGGKGGAELADFAANLSPEQKKAGLELIKKGA